MTPSEHAQLLRELAKLAEGSTTHLSSVCAISETLNLATRARQAAEEIEGRNTQVVLRHASDDFDVLIVAVAMENAGAQVFAVFPTGSNQPMLRFAVMCRATAPTTIGDIDKAIELARFGGGEVGE